MVYLSGSIKDDPDYVAKFDRYEQYLVETYGTEESVCNVINPVTLGHPADATYADYIRMDLKGLLFCDSIAMIPGWEISQGAKLEFMVATMCGMKVIYL